jgi:hypothetical protein
MLLKTLLVAAGFFVMPDAIYAQKIFFKFTDGTSATYTVSEVRNLTFSGDVMVLKKTDGTIVSWNVSSIGNYNYNAITPVNDVKLINNAEVKIYPNPFKGVVHIRYELPTAEQIGIDILDMQGRSIRSWPKEKKKAGSHEIIWQVSDTKGNIMPTGTYICRISTSKGTVSKMMVME